jgi:predicted amidohydrolase YtcJ
MFSRRDLLRSTLAGATACVAGRTAVGTRLEAQRGGAVADLLLVNGRFVDGRGVVGSALTIRDGRIVAIGDVSAVGGAARTIDLQGRTVVPGLFDAHVHYTRAGVNPGYEARRIERAFSIAELQEAVATRAASVPPGCSRFCDHWTAPRRARAPPHLSRAANVVLHGDQPVAAS